MEIFIIALLVGVTALSVEVKEVKTDTASISMYKPKRKINRAGVHNSKTFYSYETLRKEAI